MMRAALICIIILFANLEVVSGQDIELNGIVFSAKDQSPLEQVYVSAPAAQAVTTVDGKFNISVMSLPVQLRFSYVGYETLVVEIDAATAFEVLMKPQSTLLNEVIVDAEGGDRRLKETVSAISVLGISDIAASTNVAFPEVINQVPGVFMHSGALNTNRITIRGLGSRTPFATNKIKAYLNNVPLSNGVGETSIEDLPLDLFEQIEVVKGPNSSLYGAGLGGVIKMKTKSKGAGFGQVRYKTGSFGLHGIDVGARVVGKVGSLNIAAHQLKSDGFRDNNNYDRKGLFAQASFALNNQNTLSLLYNYISLEAFIPSSISEDDFINEPSKAAFTWGRARGNEDYDKHLLALTWDRDFNSDLSLSSTMFLNSFASDEIRPFNILDEKSNNIGNRTVIQSSKAQSNWNVGFEVFQEDYDFMTFVFNDREKGNLLTDQSEDRSYLNIFANYERILSNEKTRIQAGISYNSLTYDWTTNNDESTYDYGNVFSPRLGINHAISSSSNLYASVSHGFSPPSIEETLDENGLVNTDIQPETGWNFEIGSKGSLGERLSYDLSIYTVQIENLLVARRTAADVFVGVNAGKTSHPGFELDFQYDLIPMSVNGSQLLFRAGIWKNWYKFDDFVDGDDDYSGNDLTGVPNQTTNLALKYQTSFGLMTDLAFQSVGEMPLRDDNSISSDSYSLLNFGISYQLDLDEKRAIVLSGKVNNIFDEAYASMLSINAGSFGGSAPRYYYPGLPRNYVIALAVKF